MTTPAKIDRRKLLREAKEGQTESLGRLLELYRNYLYLVARTQIDLHLAVRASPSDVVQETFLQAAKEFKAFAGQGEAELVAWLRRILVSRIIKAYERHVRAARRDVRRERPLDPADLDRSSQHVHAALAASGTSPSARLERQEQATQVADRLAALPPDYKEVIILRNLEGLPFEEIAHHMARSPAAVRKLWTRAIAKLKLPP